MNLQPINASASPEVQINENFDTLDFASVYGKDPRTTQNLTWVYYGGRWASFSITGGIANAITLTDAADNYLVVAKASGVLSKSTGTTNWNNTTDYARVYKVTTAGGVVTVIEDHRGGSFGVFGLTGGLGDVVGPASAVDGRAVLFDGTTGKLVKQAGGAPVIGPASATDGMPVLFDGTTGKLVKDSTAAAVRTAIGIDNVPLVGGIGKNAIINGDMTIAQRGATFAAVANGDYGLDRWKYLKSGAMVHTVSQDADVPTVVQAGRLFTHSLKMVLTTPDTAIAAGDFCAISQNIEGYNWRSFAQRIVTVSFWFKSPITGIHCARISNGGFDRSCVKEFTVNVVNTWEKKTLTFPASPSGGTWDYINGIGAQLAITLASGATFQTTPDTWQTGNFLATANQVNGVNTSITPYFITGIQLEAGSVATEFEHRSIGFELALCQRYCCKSYDLTVAPATNTAVGQFFSSNRATAAGTLDYGSTVLFPVRMRAVPTLTAYTPAGSAGNLLDYLGNAVGASIDTNLSGHGFNPYTSGGSGYTTGQSAALRGHYLATAEL